MNHVVVKVTGGRPQIADVVEGGTVQDAMDFLEIDTEKIGFKIGTVEVQLDTVLKDGQTIVLNDNIKGGL